MAWSNNAPFKLPPEGHVGLFSLGTWTAGPMKKYDDDAAAAFYEDPANRVPVSGPVMRIDQRRLTKHVPVRFDAAVIERVKGYAFSDGMTVSAWIRHVVNQELDRRGERA